MLSLNLIKIEKKVSVKKKPKHLSNNNDYDFSRKIGG